MVLSSRVSRKSEVVFVTLNSMIPLLHGREAPDADPCKEEIVIDLSSESKSRFAQRASHFAPVCAAIDN